MADSRKTNFTYRVNTKTPTEVEEWLATKPEELSYPEFVNAAIMVARSKEGDSDLNLDSITNSLAEMVAKQNAAPTRPAGATGASPDEIGEAIAPVIESDGEATRRHIDEVAGQLSEQIGSLTTPSGATFPEEQLPAAGEGSVAGASPAEIDCESVANAVSASVSESILSGISSAVSDDGDRTRQSVSDLTESVGRMGEDVSSILEIVRSSGNDSGEVASDTSVNVIPDGQLTEDDLNFAVQRIKDTIRTDGQKTRNAIIDRIEKSISDSDEEPVPIQQGLTSEDMQAMCDLIKQSNQAMIESLEQKVVAIQKAEAQGARDIVFDEETTNFFKRIHNSVASILIRVDAMQAQLEHIQRMVERNGSTIRTMSRAVTQDDGRMVLPGGNQFGDALAFENSPEIEDLESAGKWTGKEGWMSSVVEDAESPSPATDVTEDAGLLATDGIGASEEPAETILTQPQAQDGTQLEPHGSHGENQPHDKPQDQADDEIDLSSPEAVLGSLLDGLVVPSPTDDEKQERKQRVSIPRRRRSHRVADADHQEPREADHSDVAPVTNEEVAGNDAIEDEATDDDIMQPTGKIPVASLGAESVESIIDGLDFDSVATVASDPDELLTDTLQSLLG